MMEPGPTDTAARTGSAPILVNTIPKAGTHLLEKAVRLLGCLAAGIHVEQFRLAQVPPDEVGLARQGQFEEVPLAELGCILSRIAPGRFATSHLLYSQPLADLLLAMDMKLLGILRDPRDIVVSYTRYVAGSATHYLFDDFRQLAPADQLMTAIVGITDVRLSEAVPYLPKLMDIAQMIRVMLPWQHQRNTYTTSFERLVGPMGGGTHVAQIREVIQIARHLDIPCSESQAAAVADQLFGGSATFRKGIIGTWRDHFAPQHIQAFKRVTGDLLVQLGYESDLDW